MAFIDPLIWGAVTLIIGGSVGVGASKLVNYLSKKQEENKIFDFIEEKTPNNLKLDGEIINVNKFTYKKSDGETIKEEIADIAKKASQERLKQEKTLFMKKLKDKSVKGKQRKNDK